MDAQIDPRIRVEHQGELMAMAVERGLRYKRRTRRLHLVHSVAGSTVGVDV